jgi:hypothetical protein
MLAFMLLTEFPKSIKARIEFLEILKKKGMEERDLNVVKTLLEEAAFLM